MQSYQEDHTDDGAWRSARWVRVPARDLLRHSQCALISTIYAIQVPSDTRPDCDISLAVSRGSQCTKYDADQS